MFAVCHCTKLYLIYEHFHHLRNICTFFCGCNVTESFSESLYFVSLGLCCWGSDSGLRAPDEDFSPGTSQLRPHYTIATGSIGCMNLLLKNLQASNLYKAIISMQNKQEWVAWSVGLSQLFKEPLVHSMHLCFTVYINFFCWNKGSNLIHRQIALGNSETAKKWIFRNESRASSNNSTHLHMCSLLELHPETKSKIGCVRSKFMCHLQTGQVCNQLATYTWHCMYVRCFAYYMLTPHLVCTAYLYGREHQDKKTCTLTTG